MYRYRRRKKLQRRRRATAVAVFAAVLAFAAGIPTLAAADPVNDALNSLGLGSGSGGGGTASPQQLEPPPQPEYTPPLHGTNPHGQGTGAVVDIAPEGDLPYSADPVTNGEELVVGSSRGEQNETTGEYHGSVTLAYLFGNPIVQVTTNPGETKDGPLQPLQNGLDDLCTQSSGQVCLTVLAMHSSTGSSGSTNSFQGAGVALGGNQGVRASALTSNGNISSDGTCQTSHGDSQVAGAALGGELDASVFQSSSDSTACNSGTSSVNQSSSAILLNNEEVIAPCANGTPDTVVIPLAPLMQVICNADDQNGAQDSAPYGAREALTALALFFGTADSGLEARQLEPPFLSLIKGTTAAAESHAVAPPAQVTSTPTGPGAGPGGGTQGAGGKGGGAGDGAGGAAGAGGAGGGGAGAAAGAAAAGGGELAFTGADLLALGMVGGALILGGLALTTTAGRRHRQAV
jgi:hypothetical protein